MVSRAVVLLIIGLIGQVKTDHWTLDGTVFHPELDDFSTYPKVRVELLQYGIYDTVVGDTIADVNGSFHVEGYPPVLRASDAQKLKIYHRFTKGECRVNVYIGPTWQFHFENNKRYDVIWKDESSSDDLCPTDLYP
ncbi:unnamed protein product [Bursaphelenchus xylophilus]|uniref:(pine wood nematode) hypothetical protein n=1 Tax=Bursaphelenchus xylophilus TaxID=6326 RepID=A0A1I7S2C7_BURXY|nr:unnamed protein product [Bursaphelenchus xylophilus]CAG9114671.1 unnamed protein product [Bursaphelenchus xylophilus]